IIRRPPRSTRTVTLFPYTTRVRSLEVLLPPQADLSLSIDGPATLPRRAFRAEYAFTLANGGTIAAAQPTLVIEGNTMTATASVQAPAGWQCSKQYNGSP